MPHKAEHEALAAYLAGHRLKRTTQREVILDAFLDFEGHMTSEELYRRIRDSNPRIGHTTVYRTLKLLVEAGLAQERHFDDGITRYEVSQEHHDHLLCIKCGKIVEFESQVIEQSQWEIAAHHGFRLLRHRHEIYGHCSDCRED